VNEAETPSDDEGTVVAGLGWATGPGPGLFYEATGTDSSTVRDRLERGLDAGADLREWSLPERDVELVAAEAELDAHVGVVAVAAYGTAERIGGPPVRTGESETRQI
jgi:arginine decarboxylase